MDKLSIVSYHDCQDLLADTVAPTSDQAVASYVSYQGNVRWFTVPVDKNTLFWTGYCGLVENSSLSDDASNLSRPQEIYIGEVIKEACPVFGQFIFRLPLIDDDDDPGEGISNRFIQGLVSKYQEAINHVIDNDDDEYDASYIAVVLESENVWIEDDGTGKYWCLELRLQFPLCKVETGNLSRIRSHAIKLLSASDINTLLDRSFAGDWKSVIQPIGPTLPMYGSVEIKGRPRLGKPKFFCRMEYSEAVVEENASTSIDEVFYPFYHLDFSRNSGLIKSPLFANVDEERKMPYEDLLKCLPFFLSVNYYQQIRNARTGAEHKAAYRPPAFQSQAIPGATDTPNVLLTSDNSQDMAETLLRMVKPYRYEIETYWRDIGAALYHSFRGDENGLRMWIRYSRRALGEKIPDFISRFGTLEEASKREYPTFENSGITVKTLGTYAQHDNLRDYIEWHKGWVAETYLKALEGTDNSLARCLYRSYWLDFRYAPGIAGKGSWWQFKNNRWIRLDEAIKLRKLLSSDFKVKFEILRTAMSKEAEGQKTRRHKQDLEHSIKEAGFVIRLLENNSVKNRVIAEAREFFADPDFLDRLDRKPNLTGTSNGVIEVIGATATFRKGKPEDYISLSTMIGYETSYTWDHPLVKECNKWIRRVFRNPALYNFFMKFAASGLLAGNIDKIFMLWTGVGNNSKSMVVKLFERTYGQYAKKLPYTVFSEKSGNSGAANPQIARLAGARFATTEEPSTDGEFTLNAGHIKRMTGGDRAFVRFLHDNGRDIEMTHKTIYQCNQPPSVSGGDQATHNRLANLEFCSIWGPIRQHPGDPGILPPESEEEQEAKGHYKEDE
jgi:hypothetical protein